MKGIFLEIGGWTLIVLGLLGLFLPILPGLLFLLLGLVILSARHHWARRWIVRLRERFPKADRQLRRFLNKHTIHIPGFDSSHGSE
jgi:uncharacterized membrane protein YbaN (DUF454 family)